MKRHADLQNLGGSPAGQKLSRLCALSLAAILATGGAAFGLGQSQPDAAKPAKPVTEKKAAPVRPDKIVGGYMVHESLEVGGRITSTSGSKAMWDTLVNMGTGGRILGQSLEMHSVNPAKTPFFDSLSTNSTGYGGDPTDVSYLKISKGRLYDFSGSFRRDRQYFNDNLLDNSLLTTYTAVKPVLVAEPDSLHIFNTVRRNTDTGLTLLPLSFISFRAGYNHGAHSGPSYSTIHNGGDIQVLNMFSNGSDTWSGGVDVKLAKRTSISYDQFWVAYKGDSHYQLGGIGIYALSNGSPVSLGVDVLGGTTTCGSATAKPVSTLGPEIVNGIVNPYCSGTISQTQTGPTRTTFPTEQVRFSSRYWDKLSFNGRLLYSGATSKINSFNMTFNGLDRTLDRQTILTGAGPGGQFANNKRISTSGDLGVVAELNRYLSISDSFTRVGFRNEGNSSFSTQAWVGTAGAAAKGATPAVKTTSMLTPITDASITQKTTPGSAATYLNQKFTGNTALATISVTPEFKFSAGWRFRVRDLSNQDPNSLTFHENGLLLGAVVQPSRVFRLNVNYDTFNSKYAAASTVNGLLPANTFTRSAPDHSYHFRARATVKPATWVSFAVTGNEYAGKNDDPLVNHRERNQDISFATTITPLDGLNLDFNYAHDDVSASTDLCYIFIANPNAPLGNGAQPSTGACLKTATNPNGTNSSTAVASQLYLGNGTYDAPSNFFSGSVNYAPSRLFRVSAGARLNSVNGSAEELNPLMALGGLKSKFVTPFADLQINVAPQWAWHGNWVHDGYTENGAQGPLPSRNTHGDILTVGVKHAF